MSGARLLRGALCGGLLLATGVTASAAPGSEHARSWNRFVEDVYDLHRRQLQERQIKTRTRIGGYAGQPRFYREVEYRDAASGQLLSRIRWERERPDALHVIEVFVHDAEGRVQRDYSAAYLPHDRSAPSQTLLALHAWPEGLHAFRMFDASGDRVYERCEGEYRGRAVFVEVEEGYFYDARLDPAPIFASADYQRCFAGVPSSAQAYLPPN